MIKVAGLFCNIFHVKSDAVYLKIRAFSGRTKESPLYKVRDVYGNI